MDDIFGEDEKKPWKEHPKYQDFEVKAKKYVESLGYSQPSQGASETMHTMAKKLDISLPKTKTPAKAVLAHAITKRTIRAARKFGGGAESAERGKRGIRAENARIGNLHLSSVLIRAFPCFSALVWSAEKRGLECADVG